MMGFFMRYSSTASTASRCKRLFCLAGLPLCAARQVLWSLAVQVQFYIIFPLLALMLRPG